MRRKAILFMLFLLLCAGFCAFSRISYAAEVSGKTKTAYVDTNKKALVLNFTDFSKSKKYTYTISSKGAASLQGVAKAEGVYPLNDNYKDNTAYDMVIRSQEGDTLTLHYYTANAIADLKLSQSGQKLKTTWNVKKASTYNGYRVSIYRSGSDHPDLQSKVSDGNSKSATVNVSSLTSGDYEVHLTAYKLISGTEYLGQELAVGTTYIKVPSKVTGLNAVPNTKRAVLSWTAASGASCYRVYKATSAGGKYTLAQDNITATTCTITGLKAGKKYYFKVEPVAVYNNKTAAGALSAAKAAAVPVVAGQVKGAKAVYDTKGDLILTWEKAKNATSYTVYYKKKTDTKYAKLSETKKIQVSLKKLTEDTEYQLIVYAMTKSGSKKYKSDKHSAVEEINPVRDRDKILANKVRTIKYVGKKREVYTTKKYSKQIKTAFVNYKGYSSPTPYLIWISHYTQQVTIFQGKQGDWKIIRSFSAATGTAKTRSPRGVFKVGKKEKGWYYVSTKCLYVTHFCGRNSFHTRPLFNGGGVASPTLNKPASHGCVRCKNEDAKYIYTKMPQGTTVVSY